MEERRQFVRLDTRLEVHYTLLPEGRAKRTVTKDISGAGICLFTEEPLPAGTRLQVAMKVPDQETPIHFTAEVVWSESYEMVGKTERRRSVESGIKFVEVAPKDRESVMQHVILSLRPPSAAR